jgi:hypothetical protein
MTNFQFRDDRLFRLTSINESVSEDELVKRYEKFELLLDDVVIHESSSLAELEVNPLKGLSSAQVSTNSYQSNKICANSAYDERRHEISYLDGEAKEEAREKLKFSFEIFEIVDVDEAVDYSKCTWLFNDPNAVLIMIFLPKDDFKKIVKSLNVSRSPELYLELALECFTSSIEDKFYDMGTYQEFILVDQCSEIHLLDITVRNSIGSAKELNGDQEISTKGVNSVNSKDKKLNDYLDHISIQLSGLSQNSTYLSTDSARQVFLLLIINIPLWILAIILLMFMNKQ